MCALSTSQITVAGQLHVVLKARRGRQQHAATLRHGGGTEVFPPDVDVPPEGGNVTLVLNDGKTLQVCSRWAWVVAAVYLGVSHVLLSAASQCALTATAFR